MGIRMIYSVLFLSLFVFFPEAVVAGGKGDTPCTVAERMAGECMEAVDELGNSDQELELDEEIVSDEMTNAFPKQNTFLIFAQMISALALVVVLFYLLMRFLNKRSQSFQSTKLMQNIGGVPLGSNRSVQLVKIGDRLLVVGVGETIQLLKEIEDEQEIERFIAQQQLQMDQLSQPVYRVVDLLKKMGKSQKREADELKERKPSQSEFKDLLSKQLIDVSKSQKKIHDAIREGDK